MEHGLIGEDVILVRSPAAPSDSLAKAKTLSYCFDSGSELLGSERPAVAHVPYGSEPPHPGQGLWRISAGTPRSFEAGGDSHGMSLSF